MNYASLKRKLFYFTIIHYVTLTFLYLLSRAFFPALFQTQNKEKDGAALETAENTWLGCLVPGKLYLTHLALS